jgi:SAM-dependent MidA family methyltransferase
MMAPVTGAEALLRELIAAHGPVSWSQVMEVALYSEHGFYAGEGRAGRRGDFLTSAEVGPLFGAVVASAIDAWWDEAGRPATFTVAEAGAGPGTLGRAVRAAEPACATAGALRYVLVDRAAAQQARHEGFESVGELSELGPVDVVLANELLDNLGTDLAERTTQGWREVRVGVVDGRLAEVHGEPCLLPGLPEAPPGARVPVHCDAPGWLDQALRSARRRVVVVDYCSTTAELATRPWTDWFRTYRGHARGGPPLEALGTQDLTCEVCVDQLALIAPPTADTGQADWLRAHGIEALVEEGRRTWRERAHLGDLAAVRARSRIGEAEALLDPHGLGAFRVLEWEKIG